jgi:protein tyrosine phosphatase (PTP) superfamily phosphohydrolase (DUF442 family)
MTKKGIFKRLGLVVLAIILAMVAQHLYNTKVNYNFGVVTEGKMFKSGVIPPDKIDAYLTENKIKTVIDFRHGGVGDALNPATMKEIDAERQAVNAINGVDYYNIPSVQIPTQANLDSVYKILDDKTNYPVLMHCYHGTGRAMIYSAIYKIEYEGATNEEARKITRPFYSLPFSSFSKGKPKGDFLENYKKRGTN